MRQRVPEFTSKGDERMKMLVNSCISEVDRIGMRKSRKSCAARPQEGGRHAVSKFRRAVTMKIAIENRKRSNIAADIERLKTVRGGELTRQKDRKRSNIAANIERLKTVS